MEIRVQRFGAEQRVNTVQLGAGQSGAYACAAPCKTIGLDRSTKGARLDYGDSLCRCRSEARRRDGLDDSFVCRFSITGERGELLSV